MGEIPRGQPGLIISRGQPGVSQGACSYRVHPGFTTLSARVKFSQVSGVGKSGV